MLDDTELSSLIEHLNSYSRPGAPNHIDLRGVIAEWLIENGYEQKYENIEAITKQLNENG